MKRKFPRDVEVSIAKLHNGGHGFEVRWADGAFIAEGQTAGGRRDAREAAWLALEQVGLVVDE